MFSVVNLPWSDWKPLADSSAIKAPKKPGIYRVRDAVLDEVLYVGETGAKSGLAGRISQLRTCYKDEIPYADPHTAAPALWAYSHETSNPLEVSFVVMEGGTQVRRMYEATIISLLRKEKGRSPLASFGRMYEGWVKSSPNNSSLVARGRRFRGFKDPSAARSASKHSILDEVRKPCDSAWGELAWSNWSHEIPLGPMIGLYRISLASHDEIIYIGEGRIADRLSAHIKKTTIEGHRQAALFSGDLEFSWVETPNFDSTQRKEWENDLIASHALTTGTFPCAQFIG